MGANVSISAFECLSVFSNFLARSFFVNTVSPVLMILMKFFGEHAYINFLKIHLNVEVHKMTSFDKLQLVRLTITSTTNYYRDNMFFVCSWYDLRPPVPRTSCCC